MMYQTGQLGEEAQLVSMGQFEATCRWGGVRNCQLTKSQMVCDTCSSQTPSSWGHRISSKSGMTFLFHGLYQELLRHLGNSFPPLLHGIDWIPHQPEQVARGPLLRVPGQLRVSGVRLDSSNLNLFKI